jgi:hypothetical protein
LNKGFPAQPGLRLKACPTLPKQGKILILTLADAELLSTPAFGRTAALEKRMRSVPYFRQLFLFNASGEPISGYPAREFSLINPTNEEETGIGLALKGVSTQVYVVPPLMNESSAQISFIAAIKDEQGRVLGALLGRTDLNTNPFTQPVIQALANMSELEGQGMILSEKGVILYHPVSTEIMKQYPVGCQMYPTSATNYRQPMHASMSTITLLSGVPGHCADRAHAGRAGDVTLYRYSAAGDAAGVLYPGHRFDAHQPRQCHLLTAGAGARSFAYFLRPARPPA